MDIEQQETEQQQETGTGDVTRDDLIAAVREAGGTESVDVAAEEAAAAAQTATKTEATEAAAAESDEPPIYAKIKAREEEWNKRQSAEDHAKRIREEAEKERERILQEARDKAAAEHRAFLEEQARKFRESPTEHLRSLAKDPQDIVDAVLREGTPEARALREMQRELAEAKTKASTAEQVKSEFEEWKKQQAAEKQQAMVAQARAEFFSKFATQETAPHLHARYDEHEIFERAVALAQKWKAANVPFDDGEIVAYLEHESRKRLAGLKSAPQQVNGASSTETTGKRPQGQATGTRTLSAAQGSERRTSPKPLSEMKPDEARAALMEEVAAARRANPDASF